MKEKWYVFFHTKFKSLECTEDKIPGITYDNLCPMEEEWGIVKKLRQEFQLG